MDVRCERCNTEYEFEDNRVPDTGLSVKCSTCGHVFRVFRAGSAFSPATGAPAQDWMVRRATGNVYTFKELTTLQRWIVERKVTREDQISKTGKQWKRLGDIAELAAFFQVVEARPSAPQPVVAAPAPQMAPQPGIPPSIFPQGYQAAPAVASWPVQQAPMPGMTPPAQRPSGPQPQMPYPPPQPTPYPPAGAAWEQTPQQVPAWNQPSGNWQMAAPTRDPMEEDEEPEIKRGGKGWLIAALVLVLLGGGVGVAYYMKPALFRSLLGGTSELAVGQVQAGYRELNRDSYASIERAIDDFTKATSIDEGYAEALAGLAEADLARAEYLAEEAEELSVGRAKLPEAEQAAATAAIEAKHREASELSDRAFNAAKKALQINTTGVPGNRAMADYYRFKRAPEQMRPLLDAARNAAPRDARVAYVLGSSVLGDPAAGERAIRYFDEALEADPTMERARYKLARAYLQQGEKEKAQRHLETLLKEVPEHERAAAMLKVMNPPPPPEPVTPPPPAAPTEPEKKPASFEQLLTQADKLREGDKAARAIKLYEKALELEPEDPDALTGMGWCYVDMEQPDAAIATFKRVLAKAPRLSDAHMGIAEAYRAKGSKRDAVKHYEEYLSIMPNGPDAEVARRALKDLGQ